MKARPEPIDYVLGELSGDALAEAERLMREDAEFRSAAERVRPMADHLAMLPREAWEPPPPAVPSAPVTRAPRRLVLRPLVAAVCAAALVVAGAGIAAVIDGDGQSPSGTQVALEPAGSGAASVEGSVTVVDGGEVVLRVSDVPPSGEGEFYEAWLLGEGGELVSLGGFRVGSSGAAEVRLPLPVAPDRFRFFDVSRERVDGGPGHSGDSVLRGPTRL